MELFDPILTTAPSNTLPRRTLCPEYLKKTQIRTKHCTGKLVTRVGQALPRCFCKAVFVLLQPRLSSWKSNPGPWWRLKHRSVTWSTGHEISSSEQAGAKSRLPAAGASLRSRALLAGKPSCCSTVGHHPRAETGPTGLFLIRLDCHGKARLLFTRGSKKHCTRVIQKENKHLFNTVMADLTRNTAVQELLGSTHLAILTLLENNFFNNCLG